MKKFKFFIMAAVASLMFTACSDNDLKGSGGKTSGTLQSEGEGFYMGLTVQMPGLKGSRSQTVTPGQSNDGTEVGTAGENAVANVLVVIAKESDNSFIVAGEVVNGKLTPVGAANAYKTVVKMQKANLIEYYEKESLNSDNKRLVNIFVFCNPTTDLKNKINNCELGDTKWLNYTCEVDIAKGNPSIWVDGGFLMNNVGISTRELPKEIDYWDSYKTEATAFDLSGDNLPNQAAGVDNSATNSRGAISVQRSVARFDFRDGSQDGTDKSGIANTYNVIKNTSGKTIMQVELNRMLLANMSNQFYYLPRVSGNGLAANSQICGAETPVNYVVGPYSTTFSLYRNSESNKIDEGFATYFNYPFFKDDTDYNIEGWDSYLIKTVLQGKQDNYVGPDHNGQTYDKNYKVWRYVTENVIPAPETNQMNGISTGVVFKGRFIPTAECDKSEGEKGYDKYLKEMYDYFHGIDGKQLIGDGKKDPIIYSFNGGIYFTWENVREQAIANSVIIENIKDEEGNITADLNIKINRSEPLYVAVFGDGGLGEFEYNGKTYTDPDDATLSVSQTSANWLYNIWNNERENEEAFNKFRAKIVEEEGFTIYQTSIDNDDKIPGYYCYYFYWNRHNDNGKPGIMGPMEFGVVRNNVYKLAVTGIKQLGHPRIKVNDPDPAEPKTPDENDDIYITVTCEVVPWVVRLNNIEF